MVHYVLKFIGLYLNCQYKKFLLFVVLFLSLVIFEIYCELKRRDDIYTLMVIMNKLIRGGLQHN